MITTYRDFVLSKEAPFYEIKARKSFRLIHCGLGLTTELLELIQSRNRDNTIEESGDLLWYLILTSDVLSILPESLPLYYEPKIENEITIDRLIKETEAFVSLIKKDVIYTKSKKLENQFNLMWLAYLRHVKNCNLTVEYLIKMNMDKLGLRYEKAFTPEESETRKDKVNG